ncbi:Calcineurin-like phosphoesterase domain, ApaH type [uncultured Caudovirales phage]|uniref:Calcineurin-like phosphoesterase domain, ApaH type n=1 Tax=uncultured Caudovirales phage TaxID=2100421 RepID=A0A6J5LBN2_9CAUD|nr:Calcineurin-like phosphoesterase domain, ApaH type [uncultured Caudovirales phage]CAB4135281.1 Calcineurin-like phosphoesterase domain, ApaH type [uncultured Caudovirales phage]
MKVQILSDLHLNAHMDKGKSFIASLPTDLNADVLIIAGDVATQRNGIRDNALQMLSDHYRAPTNILCVLGNHDFWGPTPPRDLVIDNLPHPNTVVVSEYRSYETGSKRILAGVMWFPTTANRGTNDFELVPEFVPWVFGQNKLFYSFLKTELKEGDIVVTHYAPSWKSVHPRFAGSPINACYISDMEDLILERKPALWVHGHVHDSFDYMIGSTRVVCNPFGYPWQLNPKFNDRLIIEV